MRNVQRVANPYRADDREIVIITTAGVEIWQDVETGRLVQIGPTTENKPGKRLEVPALRAIARAWVEAVSKKPLSSFHPLEDHKDREIYFFRWDDFSGPVSDSEMPPFIQVGITAYGEIRSFTDTLR